MLAAKDARRILQHEKGVFLVESRVRAIRASSVEVTYIVSAYWARMRFYNGEDLAAAQAAFVAAIARAPQRVR